MRWNRRPIPEVARGRGPMRALLLALACLLGCADAGAQTPESPVLAPGTSILKFEDGRVAPPAPANAEELCGFLRWDDPAGMLADCIAYLQGPQLKARRSEKDFAAFTCETTRLLPRDTDAYRDCSREMDSRIAGARRKLPSDAERSILPRTAPKKQLRSSNGLTTYAADDQARICRVHRLREDELGYLTCMNKPMQCCF